ncbi:MAG: ORF6N domain-containing protein [Verrucomicrobia bacterium]|nr:ORF6N domain-containing protein [Verrucomicrobiota bacterium]
MPAPTHIVPLERLETLIYVIRGQKVMLDSDLAALYGVPTKVLNQAVKRNLERFPEDFMFQLSEEEADLVLRSQIVTSNLVKRSQSVTGSAENPATPSESSVLPPGNWSQIVTSSQKHRGKTYRPLAFTEQGVAMLSSVLKSRRAIRVHVEIVRAFVRLRQLLASNVELARRLEALEKKYDEQFRVVFEAIRQLMATPVTDEPRKEIGFHTLREDGPPSPPPRRRRRKKPVRY